MQNAASLHHRQNPVGGKFYQGFRLAKKAFWLITLSILAWDAFELLGPPVLKDLLHESFQSLPFNLTEKEGSKKAADEARLKVMEAVQARCLHISETRGLKNYFCPLCGKKLIPGSHPWWQI